MSGTALRRITVGWWIAVGCLAMPGAARSVPIDSGAIVYHVEHPLKSVRGVMEASDAELDLTWDPDALEELRFEAVIPLGAFDSGNRLRDEHAAEALELFLHPDATWTVERVDVEDRQPEDGPWSEATLQVHGPLTLHGVTADQTVVVQAKRSGEGVSLRGSFTLALSAFDVERPALLGLAVEDTVTVEVDLEAPPPGG